jgi:lipopolysaccharide export system ATP-binding protein
VWCVRKLIENLLRQRSGPGQAESSPDDPYAYRLDEDPSGPESPPWSDAVPMQLPRDAAGMPAAATDFSWLDPNLPFDEDAAWPHPEPALQPKPQAPATPAAEPATSRFKTALLKTFPPRQHQPPAQEKPATPAKTAKAAKPPASKPAAKPAKRKAAARLEGFEGVLAVDGVEKSYRGRKVVRGVSLYVREGEAVGLLGPNGAGKTTVFYMTTGLVKADAGRIFLHGYDITAMPMYRRARLGIGYLPQEASIFRGLNVEDNIRAVLEVVEPNRRKREEELDALLEEFGIARLRKSPSIALSGGERRRCEIARALATRPSFMLLDEPFAGIDPIAVGDIQALVRHLTQRGIGVLITDHNVRETLGLIDRAYIIHSGEVLMEGSADDIVSSPDVRRLYLGEEFRL